MSIPPWLQEHCDRLVANDLSLTNLNLNIRRLDDRQLHALAVTMSQNYHLLVLNLTSSLTSSDIATIQAVVDHVTLSLLHLSYNRLEMAVSLSHSSLVELYLDHNALVDPEPLFESLRN